MEPLYIECHHFHAQNENDVIIYRITEERVMDHILFVLKYAVDDPASQKPHWKASGSYHYLDQIISELYRLLYKMEEEKGNKCVEKQTDFLAFINNKIEDGAGYLYVYGSRKNKKGNVEKLPEHDGLDFCTMKELTKANVIN